MEATRLRRREDDPSPQFITPVRANRASWVTTPYRRCPFMRRACCNMRLACPPDGIRVAGRPGQGTAAPGRRPGPRVGAAVGRVGLRPAAFSGPASCPRPDWDGMPPHPPACRLTPQRGVTSPPNAVWPHPPTRCGLTPLHPSHFFAFRESWGPEVFAPPFPAGWLPVHSRQAPRRLTVTPIPQRDPRREIERETSRAPAILPPLAATQPSRRERPRTGAAGKR